MKFKKIIAFFVLATLATSAQANLSIMGGEDVDVPMNNDFIFTDPATQYNIGGNLFADFNVALTFTFLGSEAGFNNEFYALGDSVFLSNKPADNPVGTTFSGDSLAGLIDFRFFSLEANNGFGPGEGISNGGNQPVGSFQSFATILDFLWTRNGVTYDAVLFFDDSGFDEDDNHDDHIIGITATRLSTVEVPAPGVLALVGLGLLGLRLVSRRKA